MKRHAVKARKAKKHGTTRSRGVGVIVLYMDKKRQDLVHRKHPHKEKNPVFKRIRGVHRLFNSSILGGFESDQNAGTPT